MRYRIVSGNTKQQHRYKYKRKARHDGVGTDRRGNGGLYLGNHAARLHTPNPAPENDAWIAAAAIQHGLILVTRNTADFAYTGAKLFNPFDAV